MNAMPEWNDLLAENSMKRELENPNLFESGPAVEDLFGFEDVVDVVEGDQGNAFLDQFKSAITTLTDAVVFNDLKLLVNYQDMDFGQVLVGKLSILFVGRKSYEFIITQILDCACKTVDSMNILLMTFPKGQAVQLAFDSSENASNAMNLILKKDSSRITPVTKSKSNVIDPLVEIQPSNPLPSTQAISPKSMLANKLLEAKQLRDQKIAQVEQEYQTMIQQIHQTYTEAVTCTLCCDEEAKEMLLPCNHVICASCLTKVFPNCPWDRGIITSSLKLS